MSHLLFLARDGRFHHYTVVADVLPMPLGYFFFRGQFEATRPVIRQSAW